MKGDMMNEDLEAELYDQDLAWEERHRPVTDRDALVALDDAASLSGEWESLPVLRVREWPTLFDALADVHHAEASALWADITIRYDGTTAVFAVGWYEPRVVDVSGPLMVDPGSGDIIPAIATFGPPFDPILARARAAVEDEAGF